MDDELRAIKQYLAAEDKKARELVLNKSQYEVIDNVLYHLQPDKTLRVVVTTADCLTLLMEGFWGVICAPPRYIASCLNTTGGRR